MGAETATAAAAPKRPQRPMVLSANRNKLSYRSQTGKVFTIELKNSKAAESLRENLSKPVQEDDSSEAKAANAGYWDGVYDTIAMMIEESLEIACFGPYDEALK